jgi:hypothetical protein
VKTQVFSPWLVLRSYYELLRYDALHATLGFGYVRDELARQALADAEAADMTVETVCAAMLLASCLYWKRVLCLQRSICTTRLLRAQHVPARTIIGYREVPFFSHAWVQVGSRVVNDSAEYPRRLRVLHTI